MNNLTIGSIISNGFSSGFKNLFSLIGAIVLWAITIWIPYINVGTTIGIYSLIPAVSKGETISPTGIFDKKYRDMMGRFFVLLALSVLGVMVGFIFLIIPGLVIAIAWTLAIYLLIDQDMGPLEALRNSNKYTYGKKWTIFLGLLLLEIILGIIVGVLAFVGGMISETIGLILTIIGYLVIYPILIGALAHIYGVLAGETSSPEPAAY